MQAGIAASFMIEVDTQLERDTMESSKRSLMDLMQKGRQIISISLWQTSKASSSSMPPPPAESTVLSLVCHLPLTGECQHLLSL